MVFRIGTRGSRLALTQSRIIKEKLEERYPGIRVELVKIKTTGDKILDSPLSRIGGKGLFVKEIEEALLEKRVDAAVHSLKDVPAELPDALTLSSFPEREDPRDALISREDQTLDQLPQRARVGTSSLRRAAQLLHLRPDLDIVPLRGNVDTRLGKLESGDLNAVVLAVSGLRRLGYADRITQIIPSEKILPAIGQGTLGLEVRRDDEQTINLLCFMNHEPTELAVVAERAFLRQLEGGCQVPMAALARLKSEKLRLQGMVAGLDGSIILEDEITGEKCQAEEIGVKLGNRMLDSGADRILARIYGKA
ncbi:MAG: hydroxymethylbilane synthase [Thermodesulfobacteriota bacterium]|nr:hydroxymethylbilane synthase [Thermodesulfobacteriota bacterium]